LKIFIYNEFYYRISNLNMFYALRLTLITPVIYIIVF